MPKWVKWLRGKFFVHAPLQITCGEFEDFILAYLQNELAPKQRFVFRMHIKICRECRDYLISYQRTIEVSKRVFEDPDRPVPDEIPEDLVIAILAAREH